MRSPLDALITQKALALVSVNDGVLDLVCDGRIEADLPLKNVCAKVSPELSAEIDRVCALLGVSKRRFLEAAFIEAVSKAEQIMEAEGVYEVHGRDQSKGVGHAQA